MQRTAVSSAASPVLCQAKLPRHVGSSVANVRRVQLDFAELVALKAFYNSDL
jgi:hypothetical protein